MEAKFVAEAGQSCKDAKGLSKRLYQRVLLIVSVLKELVVERAKLGVTKAMADLPDETLKPRCKESADITGVVEGLKRCLEPNEARIVKLRDRHDEADMTTSL